MIELEKLKSTTIPLRENAGIKESVIKSAIIQDFYGFKELKIKVQTKDFPQGMERAIKLYSPAENDTSYDVERCYKNIKRFILCFGISEEEFCTNVKSIIGHTGLIKIDEPSDDEINICNLIIHGEFEK